jgi:hypothetical protein
MDGHVRQTPTLQRLPWLSASGLKTMKLAQEFGANTAVLRVAILRRKWSSTPRAQLLEGRRRRTRQYRAGLGRGT